MLKIQKKIKDKIRKAVACGLVWEEDGLGVEKGRVSGVLVELFHVSGALVASGYTNTKGSYRLKFRGRTSYLRSKNFYVKVSNLPSGYKFKSGVTRKSHVDLSSGLTPYFNFRWPYRMHRRNNACVKAPSGKICVLHYNDLNGDCIRDPGEAGIAGIDALVTLADGTTITVTTAEDGWACFEVPCPETLVLSIDFQTTALTEICNSNGGNFVTIQCDQTIEIFKGYF
jgi:hypothetical protein